MRMAFNVVTTLGFVGAFDEAATVASQHCELAASSGARTWVSNFAILACASLVGKEDYDAAEPWLIKAKSTEGIRGGAFRAMPRTNELEIALWRGDRSVAESAFAEIRELSGRTLRFDGYIRGTAVRLAQLDATFRCSDEELRELQTLHRKVQAFGCADSLSAAIHEALRRTDRCADADSFLADYARVRREGPVLGPAFKKQARCTGVGV